jgi:hypothetical protein
VCPRAASLAAAFAEKEIARMKEGSALFANTTLRSTICTTTTDAIISEEESCDDEDNSASSTPHSWSVEKGLPFLDTNDIVIGDRLGEGGYCKVSQCTINKGDEAGQTFAIKYLKRETMTDLHQFKHGAADLALEAQYVAQE